MGFWWEKLWVTEEQRFYGLCSQMPINQFGNWKFLWVIGDYGLSQLWVKTALTVNEVTSYLT